MSLVSIIIPSRNETYKIAEGMTVLQRTVQDIYDKATGDFEVIVIFDGPPYQELPNLPNLSIVKYPDVVGMKPAINAAAQQAGGRYLMKVDAHCMFSPGFNEVMQVGMQDNWLLVPRLYTLDAENWKLQDGIPYDHFFLSCPFTDPKGYRFMPSGYWKERTRARLDIAPLDETMVFQGSCWFASRDYFLNGIGGLTSVGYTEMWMETFELALKTWLGPWDGKVMVNKSASVAHMHKGAQRPRGYGVMVRGAKKVYEFTARYWMENRWAERHHDLQWLVDRFWPVPTWPDDWKARWNEGSISGVSPEASPNLNAA